MAKYTNEVTLTTSWQVVSTAGAQTCIVSHARESEHEMEVATVDAVGDMASAQGHRVTPNDIPSANFYGLGSRVVIARKRHASLPVIAIVTAY